MKSAPFKAAFSASALLLAGSGVRTTAEDGTVEVVLSPPVKRSSCPDSLAVGASFSSTNADEGLASG